MMNLTISPFSVPALELKLLQLQDAGIAQCIDYVNDIL